MGFKIGFIGAGNMAFGLIKGIMNNKNIKDADIFIYDPSLERQEFMKGSFNTAILNSVGEVVENADIVFIAVKPNMVADVLNIAADAIIRMYNEVFSNADNPDNIKKAGPSINILDDIVDDDNNNDNSNNAANKTIKDIIFVSIAGGVRIEAIDGVFHEKFRGKYDPKIIRIMPNINSLAGKGMSAVCYNNAVKEEDYNKVKNILEMSSKVLVLEEKYFDAVTAVSGSGPAYFFLIAEGFIEAAVKLGLPRHIASILSIQTLAGSGELLNSEEFSKYSTKDLKDLVTSPGGTTAYGLSKLEEGRIKYVIDSAVNAAYLRSKELGN
ncbi:MAG: pyrroline-5-carboxylate reductase [Candidatus Acididesulfobacter diazotrophicus]|jgi:pyrroline-5-carboxylate reductase|uniref:Pyrroline-5-carboxylate reductase n=1 Tax=Candidatus Acididesulfobacter diazotrophicus TaxID=2597226 RepID=A0A519BPW9_9DELT|nr:MAG: pyrroline-5-carboxylate reductase [Candidatus Acididesulfobacter diazotrophicus]